MDFQKYNIKEKKQKEKRKKKPQELLKQNKTKQKTTNNRPKSIYGVCLKKKKVFFLKIIIIGYRNKN